jgi:hypothetical protein
MSFRILLLATVTLTSMSATRAFAGAPIPLPITVGINFAEVFTLVTCPSNAPSTASCVNITGTANVAGLGAVSFQRTSLIPNATLYGLKDPNCIPDDTTGTVTSSSGTLTLHGPGSICLLDQSASYGLIVTGGTGAFKGVIAGGQITVLPPETASTGRELWRLDVFPPSSAE